MANRLFTELNVLQMPANANQQERDKGLAWTRVKSTGFLQSGPSLSSPLLMLTSMHCAQIDFSSLGLTYRHRQTKLLNLKYLRDWGVCPQTSF